MSPWLRSGVFLLILTAILATVYLWVCPAPSPLTAAEARAAIRKRLVSVVIDVRTDAEWATGHFPDAHHVPLQQIPNHLPQVVSDRSTPILFYCHTGRRAAAAARVAQELGYTHTYFLAHGDYRDIDENHHPH